MTLTAVDHLLYALAWGSFGLGHSWLAGAGIKAKLKDSLGPRYRLTYNAIAVVHIAMITRFGQSLLSMEPLFPNTVCQISQLIVSLTGLGLFILFLRSYDLSLLAGTKQIKLARAGLPPEDEQPLTIEGPHRYMRHPLYAAGFLILWGLAGTEYGLTTAIWGSAYLIIGAWFEERRLTSRFGQAYINYKAQVPAFIPWRGRVRLQSGPN